MTELTALAPACTLKPSPADSSAVLLGRQVLDALAGHGVGFSTAAHLAGLLRSAAYPVPAA